MILLAQLVLVLLHTPDGSEVTLNSNSIVAMFSGREDQPNKLVSEKVNCVINTEDGKFISVIETCDKVRELAREGGSK